MPAGAVLYSKLRPYLRKSLLAQEEFFASSEFLCLLPLDVLDAGWLRWATLTDFWDEWAAASSYGAKMPRTSWEQMAELPVPLLSLEEQRSISNFLDAQVSLLDAMSMARRLQARLVEERLSEDIALLFAGPSIPLKELLVQHPCYGVLVPEFVSEGVPFIRVSDLNRLTEGVTPDLVCIPETLSSEYRRTIVRAGDVLLSVVGSTDKVAIVSAPLAGANIARAVARLVPRADVPAIVLAGWIETQEYRVQVQNVTATDTAQPTLNMGDLRNFRISLPHGNLPKLAADLRRLMDLRQDLRQSLRSSTALLEERKRALITACVTGEFDVSTAGDRAAQAALQGVSR